METKQGYFDPKMPRHLDDRFYKATVVEILAIPEGARFKGMEIYAYDEGNWWQFKDGVQDINLVASERGGDVAAKSYGWTWSEGVDVGGTHLDFVIATATEDDEIGAIEACIFFVGGSLQVDNFTIQNTNFDRDTVRIPGTAGEREGTVEVVLFYNRSGLGSALDAGSVSIEAFNPSIKADKKRYFPDYQQTGVINLVKDGSVANAVAGETIPDNGNHGIIVSNGNAINHTNDFDFLVKDTPVNGEKFALTAIWRGTRFSAALQQVQDASDTAGPTMSSLVVAADNLTAELFFNEETYANDDGTGDLQLTDFGTATLTGGTATAPVLSNPVHTAGDSSITFDLSFTGTADGTEVLEIPVADGSSIYDVSGNAMDAGQSAVDNLRYIIMQDDFTGTSIDTAKWDINNPEPSSVAISQNNELIFTSDTDNPTSGPNYSDDNVTSDDSITEGAISVVTSGTNVGDAANNAVILSGNFAAKTWAEILHSGGNALIRIFVANTQEYSFSTGVSFAQRWKIVYVHGTNLIQFYYWGGASWTQVGTDQNFAINTGSGLKAVLSANSKAGGLDNATSIYDAFDMVNTNYSTERP